MKKYLSPYLFFFIKDSQLVVWDYKNHAQYQVEARYLSRLLDIASGNDSSDPVDQELLDANLISFNETNVEWGWDVLSQIFHFGVHNIPVSAEFSDYQDHIEEYVQFCEGSCKDMPSLYTEKVGSTIALPAPNVELLSRVDLWGVLSQRKTCRSFDAIPVSLTIISTLLYAVFGNIHPEWPDLEKHHVRQLGLRKSSPSAGALHSCEAYLVAMRVENLQPGIYHYQSHSHKLTLIQEIDVTSTLGHLLADQMFAERLSAGVFISARFEKTWHKYHHSRSYAELFLDTGHLSQTFQLCVTALGLKPWLTGIFLDDEVSKLLKIEGSTEYPLFFVGVGQGDGNSLSQEMQAYFSQLEGKINEKNS